MTSNNYKYTYEKLDKDGEPLVQVNYNSAGEIGQIFVYSSHVDGMILIDLEAFMERWPTKFDWYQHKVDEQLSGQLEYTDKTKEYNKYE